MKVSAGFFDNPKKGLPSLGGLMLVFDAETGVPRSALFDNGYLTDLRTALAGAVAARHLAIENASHVAVFGAGMQARLQVEALLLVRPVERVSVWARRPEAAEKLAAELSTRLDVAADPTSTGEAAVAAADILVTTTPSSDPLVTEGMLHPGLHITAVGADAEGKQELAADVVTAADRFVCDSIVQSARLGELRAALEAGYDRDRPVELGGVISGDSPGRTSETDVTICDLTGTGAQDTAIASLAVERCARSGAGIALET